MQINDPDVIVEQDFPCSQQVLWRAITDPAQMRQWFFDNIPNFEPRVGFKTEFTVDAGERQFLHQWDVGSGTQRSSSTGGATAVTSVPDGRCSNLPATTNPASCASAL
ncbi:MAG: SRPBCC domain-containing protein [Pseudohongiellaceae bacterium]